MRLLSNITFHLAVLATVASCGGQNPIQPPPPPPGEQLQLACPAAMVREATTAQGTDVHFDAPAPSGGREPYSVQCEPGSSSMFAIGETAVRCTATDVNMTQASCGFRVTVRASQTIAKTKFMAFGDSITDGAVSLAPLVMLGPPDTYPFKLEQMLRERYPSQEILVVNEGHGGEDTREGARRLPQVLEAGKPEVLLLLEGINNLGASTATQANALRTMIREAQSRQVDVIVATVMPVLPTWRLYQPGTTTQRIEALNAQIFGLAAEFNLGPPVDLYALFDANPHLIGRDGLHPSLEGQTRIAETFRDEIVRRYGSDASSTSLHFSTMRRAR
jgi:lysophospholipase L1-like esterase